MEKTLTVAVEGGLCNRLHVAFSARLLAERRGDVDVRIKWDGRHKECAARFDQLFRSADMPWFTISESRFADLPARRSNLWLPDALRRLEGYDLQLNRIDPRPKGLIDGALDAHSNVYLSTCYPIIPLPDGYLAQCLRPIPELQARIDAITSRYRKRHTTGLHIRRTDNAASISQSPDEAFLRAIDERIAADADALFFVATDDEDFKQRLIEVYPGRIITQQTENRRDTAGGIQCAVVDVWCLAMTDGIVGSAHSSFSEVAAEIGGIKLEVAGI